MKKINSSPLKTKRYYVSLVIICIVYSIVFFFFLQQKDMFISSHEFEYYTKSVYLARYPTLGNFFNHYYGGLSNKLIYLRTIPAMWIFGYSRFVFRYAACVFNIFIMLLFFHWSSKILGEKHAFLYTLFYMNSYFFVELLFNPYVDLTFAVFGSIFLFQLKLYLEARHRISNLNLIIMVFLLFMAKNSSYVFIPIMIGSSILYLWIFKLEKIWSRMSGLILVSLVGFLLYWAVMGGFSPQHLKDDIGVSSSRILNQNIGGDKGQFQLMRFHDININIRKDLGFLDFFANNFLNSALCLFSMYLLLKKKQRYFVFMLLVSVVYMFIVLNILKNSSSQRRFFLQFYSVYLMIFFSVTLDLVKKAQNINLQILPFAYPALVILSVFSMSTAFSIANPIYSMENGRSTTILNNEVLGNLPACAMVFVDSGPFGQINYYEGFSMIIDLDHFGLGKTLCKTDVATYDKRFRYMLVPSPEQADFVLCGRCRNINLNRFLKIDEIIVPKGSQDMNLSLYTRIS